MALNGESSPPRRRWVMPVELSRESLRVLQQHRPGGTANGTLMPGRACNGYWHGKPGFEQVIAPNRA